MNDNVWRKYPNRRPSGFNYQSGYFDENEEYLYSIELCSYENAGLIAGIDDKTNRIIHNNIRRKFFDFKSEILEMISKVHYQNLDINIMEEFLTLMHKCFLHGELELLLKLEKKVNDAYNSNMTIQHIRNYANVDRESSYFIASFENFYSYVFHFFCETKFDLYNSLIAKQSTQYCTINSWAETLSLDKKRIFHNYFEYIKHNDQKVLDLDIDEFFQKKKEISEHYEYWFMELSKMVHKMKLHPDETGLRCPYCNEVLQYVDMNDFNRLSGISKYSVSSKRNELKEKKLRIKRNKKFVHALCPTHGAKIYHYYQLFTGTELDIPKDKK